MTMKAGREQYTDFNNTMHETIQTPFASLSLFLFSFVFVDILTTPLLRDPICRAQKDDHHHHPNNARPHVKKHHDRRRQIDGFYD